MSVTFEDMEKARGDYNKVRKEFTQKYFDFLTDVLKETGMYNKLVKIKDRDLIGQLKINSEPYDMRPWEIKFYPLTKSGTISLKSKYVCLYSWHESNLVERLLNVAEVVGDLP